MAKKKPSAAANLIQFTLAAWEDYQYWQEHESAVLLRINALIKDCRRSPFLGIGKPEPLKRDLAGFWSRRINKEHRLVYKYEQGVLTVLSCRHHY